MRIDHFDVFNLRFEYPNACGFHYAGGTCTARVTSVVRVVTDTGHVGVGSAYAHPGLVRLVVKEQLEPLMRGKDPREVEARWDEMYGLTRWYGRKGAAVSAIGALDIAFWDLRAKAAGKPLWKLLGGAAPACPAYASGLLWNTYEGLAAEATRHLERGFRRMKMRMARSEEYDTQSVRAIRKAIGPKHDLMADAGMRYGVDLATRVGKVLEEEKVFWFEEPFTPEAIDRYRAMKGRLRVPIAAGENEFGLQGFTELMTAGWVDIAQPDACRCGGLTEALRVAKFAATLGVKIAPHTWSDAVALHANAAMVASIPHGLTVEVDQTGNPFIEKLLAEPLTIRDGMLKLSDAPGLGIELDMKVVESLTMADPLRVPEGNYSDMVFGPSHWTPPGPYKEGVA